MLENNRNETLIRPVVVGTAGHVDHGKTALVRHLTGRDTDTLQEEQARGLTINLGFAPCRLPDDSVIGVIDVPGHTDFLRNMIAGASAIDIALLVVAADDGVMPQTTEHLQLVQHLAKPRIIAVITKIDKADAELRDLVKAEVAEMLLPYAGENTRTVCVSNQTGEGIDELRETLQEVAAMVMTRRVARRDDRAFRMPILRVFSKKGSGTVVTGVPLSGSVAARDSVQRVPGGIIGAVRSVQSYGAAVEAARARVCCALNLRDMPHQHTTRGMVIASPDMYTASASAILRLANSHSTITFKTRTEVRFHAGTSATVGRVRLLGQTTLAPGESAFAQIELREPVVMATGDRFVIRTLTPSRTIGGGVVLSNEAQRIKRVTENILARFIRSESAVLAGDVFAAGVHASASPIISRRPLARLTQCNEPGAESTIRQAQAAGILSPLGDEWWCAMERLAEIAKPLARQLAAFHADHPHQPGMNSAQVGSVLGIAERCFSALWKILKPLGVFSCRKNILAMKGFKPTVDTDLTQWCEAVLAHVTAAGVKSAPYKAAAESLKLKPSEMKKALTVLIEAGQVSVIQNRASAQGSLLLTEIVDASRAAFIALAKEQGRVTLGAFRERAGLARNLAVALLEMFDAQKISRREGDVRVLLEKPS